MKNIDVEIKEFAVSSIFRFNYFCNCIRLISETSTILSFTKKKSKVQQWMETRKGERQKRCKSCNYVLYDQISLQDSRRRMQKVRMHMLRAFHGNG